MADSDQKTHEPTQLRRQQALDKGQVAYSQELVQSAVLLAGVLALWTGAGIVDGLRFSVRSGLADLRTDLDHQSVIALATKKLYEFGATVGPLLFGLAFTAIAAAMLQTRLNVSLQALEPQGNRLSPLSGLSRLWSSRSVARTLVALAKATAVVAIMIFIFQTRFGVLSLVGRGSLADAVSSGWDTCIAAAIAVAGAMVIVGVLDFLFQRWKNEEDLKMSFQELKDDNKEQEGDPMVRARLRKLQRERATSQMVRDVQDATVVVTNPTHISVALKYDRATMPAPKIVAMGADHLALRIRKVATTHDVPIVENKSLARVLFSGSEVGDEIPVTLYRAVAEILSGILRTRA